MKPDEIASKLGAHEQSLKDLGRGLDELKEGLKKHEAECNQRNLKDTAWKASTDAWKKTVDAKLDALVEATKAKPAAPASNGMYPKGLNGKAGFTGAVLHFLQTRTGLILVGMGIMLLAIYAAQFFDLADKALR